MTAGGNGTAALVSKKLETGAPATDITAAKKKTRTAHPPVQLITLAVRLGVKWGEKVPGCRTMHAAFFDN